MNVPYFRPPLGEAEVAEVVACLKSGWLTTGQVVKRFESEFAAAVNGRFAVAVNSATAALHLAVEALHLQPGQGVLVPSMTFAATAEVVRHMGAYPILVDCDPRTSHLSLADAEQKLVDLRAGQLPGSFPRDLQVVGIIPVHVAGLMLDLSAVHAFAQKHRLWVIEDAAHAFPAAWRSHEGAAWQRCGEGSSTVTCFSFYANKTITTAEGGMAVTADPALAERMRRMSLHGISTDGCHRQSDEPAWDYRILTPGFKYNLTDIAAAIGVPQLARAEHLRTLRENLAQRYQAAWENVPELELPVHSTNRIQSWHLYALRLRTELLRIDRNRFVELLKARGVGCSVHWRPLHLHPYYENVVGWKAEQFPAATSLWPRLISMPIFPDMRDDEFEHVVRIVRELCQAHRK